MNGSVVEIGFITLKNIDKQSPSMFYPFSTGVFIHCQTLGGKAMTVKQKTSE